MTTNDLMTINDAVSKMTIKQSGDAVYTAMVMVGEIPANTVSARLANTPEQQTTATAYFGKAYPNPANNAINLNYKIEEGQNATLAIYNLMGQLIEKVDLSSDKTTVTLNTNNFIQGLYFINISLDNRIISNDKVVIIK